MRVVRPRGHLAQTAGINRGCGWCAGCIVPTAFKEMSSNKKATMSRPAYPCGRELFRQFRSGQHVEAMPRQAQNLPARAEQVLRDMAFVLHMTSRVKESLERGQGRAQDGHP